MISVSHAWLTCRAVTEFHVNTAVNLSSECHFNNREKNHWTFTDLIWLNLLVHQEVKCFYTPKDYRGILHNLKYILVKDTPLVLEVGLAMLLKRLSLDLALVRPSVEWVGFTAVLSTLRKKGCVYAYVPLQRQVIASPCTPPHPGRKEW